MDDDSRPLLNPPASEESVARVDRNPCDSTDPRSRRPFYIEPTNIVSVNYDQEDDLQQVTDQASAMNKRIHYYSKLSNRSKTPLIAPDHVIPTPEEIYIYSPLGTAYKIVDGEGKNSSIITIFMIWNTMMGTSILSIPWGIKQAGFTTGICILFVMALLTLYCCYRVVTSRATIPTIDTSTWEFPDVCKYYFGSFGQWSSLLFSLVSLVGATIVYWVLMSNFLFNTGKFIYNYVHNVNITDTVLSSNGSDRVICPDPGTSNHANLTLESIYANNTGELQQFEMWWSKTRTVPVYLIVVLLPLLNFKSPAFFAKFNVLGTVSVVYLVCLVTLKVAHLGFHLDFQWITIPKFDIPEFRWSFPQFTGVLTLAFFIHNCVITLLKNNRIPENNVRDLSVAYVLVGLTYMYVGIMMFAAFPAPLSKDCIEQNFLDNFPSSDILSFVARIFLLFQMMTVYPLLGYFIRVQLLGQIFGDVYPSFFHVLVLNIGVVGGGVLMAEFYPNIGGIIRYSGATCGLAFVFVYPSLIHMIALYRTGQLTWPSLIFHTFIMALGMANLVAQFLM